MRLLVELALFNSSLMLKENACGSSSQVRSPSLGMAVAHAPFAGVLVDPKESKSGKNSVLRLSISKSHRLNEEDGNGFIVPSELGTADVGEVAVSVSDMTAFSGSGDRLFCGFSF